MTAEAQTETPVEVRTHEEHYAGIFLIRGREIDANSFKAVGLREHLTRKQHDILEETWVVAPTKDEAFAKVKALIDVRGMNAHHTDLLWDSTAVDFNIKVSNLCYGHDRVNPNKRYRIEQPTGSDFKYVVLSDKEGHPLFQRSPSSLTCGGSITRNQLNSLKLNLGRYVLDPVDPVMVGLMGEDVTELWFEMRFDSEVMANEPMRMNAPGVTIATPRVHHKQALQRADTRQQKLKTKPEIVTHQVIAKKEPMQVPTATAELVAAINLINSLGGTVTFNPVTTQVVDQSNNEGFVKTNWKTLTAYHLKLQTLVNERAGETAAINCPAGYSLDGLYGAVSGTASANKAFKHKFKVSVQRETNSVLVIRK